MPIYAYRCSSCGHTRDVLRKLSDPPLSHCPACGAPAFVKQITAAGFQLKGSGWYATDFKNNHNGKPKPAATGPDDKAPDKPADGAAPKAADTASSVPAAAAAPASNAAGGDSAA